MTLRFSWASLVPLLLSGWAGCQIDASNHHAHGCVGGGFSLFSQSFQWIYHVSKSDFPFLGAHLGLLRFHTIQASLEISLIAPENRLVPDILLRRNMRFLRHCFLLDECFNCFSFVFKILLFVFLLWHYVFDLIVKLPDIILLSTQKLGHITFQLSNFKLWFKFCNFLEAV